ncbi:MAG: FAD-dependent oxidoreductase [Bacteroidota bacterium]
MKRRDFIHTGAVGAAFLSLNGLQAFSRANYSDENHAFCVQSERLIPIVYKVDVAVIGGSTAAVAAAVNASKSLAKVFLVAQEPYLGEDICGTYRFWPENEQPKHELAQKLYDQGIPTPMHVKRTLDKELIDNGVDFLYSSFVTNIITNSENEPAGIIISNRSGSQAIVAKTIIDATPRAVVARMSRATFTSFPKGKQRFKFIVVGNETQPLGLVDIRKIPEPVVFENQSYPVFEYTAEVDMKDGSFASFAEAEQKVRDLCWDANQVDSGDQIFHVPPDHMEGQKRCNKRDLDPYELDLKVFLPEKEKNLFVIGGCADITRESAEQLLQPLGLLIIADRIGEASALLASRSDTGSNLRVTGELNDSVPGDVGELLSGLRPSFNKGTVLAENHSLPVLGSYDVLVVGGGTAGAPATIGAARHGAKTLVLEYMHGLGGIGTYGLVGRYWHGYRKGYTHEVDMGVKALGGENPRKRALLGEWVFDWKIEYYRREIRKAGGTIWFGVIGCGAYIDKGKVKGVVVATPFGKGVVLGNTIIDSTGSADIAIAAGAGFVYTDDSSVAVQGSGLPYKNFNDFYNNTDWTYIDDSDMLDVWRAFIVAKDKFKGQYDVGKLPQTRERRRVIGDFTISVLDIYNKRTYPDTISIHITSFDTHGFTEDPFFALKPPALGGVKVTAYVPFRALLPKGLEGIIVTGLGASAHRDAMPVIRMQPCLQNQGYAVGWAASIAAKNNQEIRYINLKSLQKELVKFENLPETVLTDVDNYPPSIEMVKNASITVVNKLEGLEILLWDRQRAIPIMIEEFESSQNPQHKLIYAQILGLCNNDTGWKELQKAVDAYEEWDEGWVFKAAYGQFGASMSYLDSLIIALGKSRKIEVIQSISRLAIQLGPESPFSHFRATAIALETIGSTRGTKVLYRLLQLPGMTGHSMPDIQTAKEINEPVFSKKIIQPNLLDNIIRRNSLRELILARALYRCGDFNGLGERILIEYSNDLRGHFYRHASGVLEKYS